MDSIAAMLRQQREGVIYFTFGLFACLDKLVHAISSRLGGISQGAYYSLNLAFHVGDDSAAVLKNREIFCHAIGLPLDSIVVGEQVHGTNIALISYEDRSRGAYSLEDGLRSTDAMITDIPGLSLLVLVADCPALLLFDPIRSAIGLVHASWRGTVERISQKVVHEMKKAFGSRAEDILVGVSPSIGPCCYEVGEAVSIPLKQAFPRYWKELIIQNSSSMYLNLWKANKYQLKEAGVKDENIEIAGICSACHSDLFYSYRAEKGKTGRNGVVVSMMG